MPMDFKRPGHVNCNFTNDRTAPLRSKGYNIRAFTNENVPRRSGSSYARPLEVHLYDENHRKILTMNLSNSTITVGNKIVFDGQKILHHGSPLSLKQLRAEAARWCWRFLHYIPEELIPGRKMKDEDYSIVLEALFKE